MQKSSQRALAHDGLDSLAGQEESLWADGLVQAKIVTNISQGGGE